MSEKINPINRDRWLEVDLYWFEYDNPTGAAQTFWQRLAPLFQGVTGYRGLILSIGFIMEPVLTWSGDLNQRLPIAMNMRQQGVWFDTPGALTGSTEERKRKAAERFAQHGESFNIQYGPWTWQDLSRLFTILKEVAHKEHGLNNIMVGTSVLGWDNIYNGNRSAWAKRHPQAYDLPVYSYNIGTFNPHARLNADDNKYGAWPNGVRAGTPVTEFFGRQWGSLSRAVGFDAIVLRDSMIGAGVYKRLGPYGGRASPDPRDVQAWTEAVTALVRETKQANPAALVMGYSSAAGAVCDWRVNCVDLETVAREGGLDIWIDQTWAGAWNEVGVRGGTSFWNLPLQGWTYQMANMLMHGAILAGTGTRHYQLTEAIDAWEDWNVLHTVPERLRWGIWAYSHAAVKTPDGLKLPDGAYVSWPHQGKRLLTPEEVEFLASNLNEAAMDADNMSDTHGATLVYCRDAMQWQSENQPAVSIKELIDEQAGTVMKWPVPITSATRLEFIDQVQSDLFIFQTPVHMHPQNKAKLRELMVRGQPCAFFGSPTGGVDVDLAWELGIESEGRLPDARFVDARLEAADPRLARDIPAEFMLFQAVGKNRLSSDAEVLYSVNGSPVLWLNRKQHRMFWDPAEIPLYPYPEWNTKPLIEILGSVYPFVLTARALTVLLAETDAPHAVEIDPMQAVFLGAWRLKDGSLRLLLGNLEEGLRHDADLSRRVTVKLPAAYNTGPARSLWQQQTMKPENGELKVELQPFQSVLLALPSGQA